MLDEKNPVVYLNGGRRYKMYNFLSEVIGITALKDHLNQVYGIGSSVRTKVQFDRGFLIAFPAMDSEPELPFLDI